MLSIICDAIDGSKMCGAWNGVQILRDWHLRLFEFEEIKSCNAGGAPLIVTDLVDVAALIQSFVLYLTRCIQSATYPQVGRAHAGSHLRP